MLCSFLLLALAPTLQDPGDRGQEVPPGEKPKALPPAEAAAAIEEALKGKDLVETAAVIQAQGRVADEAVTKEVARAARHKDPAVRLAALEALRFNEDDSASACLLKLKGDKTILNDKDLAAGYFLALGQKGDKRALPILTDGLRLDRSGKAIQPRIQALGRIRDKESVEALVSLLVSSGGRNRRDRVAYMSDINVSLRVLTGADPGKSVTDWVNWWGDNKRSFKLPKVEQPLPEKGLQARWDLVWATPEKKAEYRRKVGKAGRELHDPDKDPGSQGGKGGGDPQPD